MFDNNAAPNCRILEFGASYLIHRQTARGQSAPFSKTISLANDFTIVANGHLKFSSATRLNNWRTPTNRDLPVYREHLWSQEGIRRAPLQPERESTVWIHILQLPSRQLITHPSTYDTDYIKTTCTKDAVTELCPKWCAAFILHRVPVANFHGARA